MHIKIVRRPIGEAPDWVRDAWIGLSLPLADDQKHRWWGLGVLSGPNNAFLQLWALVLGKGIRLTGFSVNAKAAVDLLEDGHPTAAGWWRQHTPDLVGGNRNFVFDADACERVE